jgi:hypothetical protein
MSKGLAAFFGTLTLLAVLRVGMAYFLVSETLRIPVSFLITVVFVALPILALFRAGSHPWTVKLGFGFVAVGMILQFLLPFASPGEKGFAPILIDAISQQGLPIWTVGLGALLALFLKDKNLLLPVSIFLALFDVFLVFTPVGFVQVLMKKAPNLLPAMAHRIPQVATTQQETGVPVGTFAHVGPADFLFLGMFFVALYRFEMRTSATFKWLLVALAIYLPLVLVVGPVPLLVPLGLTVLLVNIREVKMTLEEKVSTAVIAAIGIGIIVFAATRPRLAEPAEPSPEATAPMPQGLEDSLAPAPPG